MGGNQRLARESQREIESACTAPPEVSGAGKEWREENDSLNTFITERCVLNPNASVDQPALYRAYKAWAQDSNEFSLGKKTFNEELRRRDLDENKTGSRGYYWIGIGLITENERLTEVE